LHSLDIFTLPWDKMEFLEQKNIFDVPLNLAPPEKKSAIFSELHVITTLKPTDSQASP
jgi:hypothetical protein